MSEEIKNGEQEFATPETNVSEEQVSTGEAEQPESQDNDIQDLREQLKADIAEIGSLKREMKEALKKTSPESSEKTDTPNPKKSEDNLVEKAYLRSAQITDPDEVELALETSSKWDMPIDRLVDDEDFKVKLDRLRTQKSNENATSNVRGSGAGQSEAKSTPEYWIAKGVPPTREQVPNDKVRRQISRAFLNANKGGGKTFYNE